MNCSRRKSGVEDWTRPAIHAGDSPGLEAAVCLRLLPRIQQLLLMPALCREALEDAFGAENVLQSEPVMGGEDFSHMLRAVPGAYFNIGCAVERDGVNYGHHHPKFDIDEDCLAIGVQALVSTALHWLDRKSHP